MCAMIIMRKTDKNSCEKRSRSNPDSVFFMQENIRREETAREQKEQGKEKAQWKEI